MDLPLYERKTCSFSYDIDSLFNDAQIHFMNTLHKIINYIYIYKIVVIMNIVSILHHAICASYTNPPIHLNSAKLNYHKY